MWDKFVWRLCIAAEFDPFKLFFLIVIFWCVEEIISGMIETLITGDSFVHWGDVTVGILLFGFYVYCINKMLPEIIIRTARKNVKESKE